MAWRASGALYSPAGSQSFALERLTRREFLGVAVAAPFAASAALASVDEWPTDLLFDPETVDDRTVIRISEVTDSSITDFDVLSVQRKALALLPVYELWLDAFGPEAAYELKIYDNPRRYDLLLKKVRLGELAGVDATLSFCRQSNNRWSLGLSIKSVGLTLSEADLRGFVCGKEALAGVLKVQPARKFFSGIFDGHLRAEAAAPIRVDRHLVWHVTDKASLSAFDGDATLINLSFNWAISESGAGGRKQTQFVAAADAVCHPISLGGGSLGPCLELQPGTPKGKEGPAPVAFSAGPARKGDNPRIEVRLSCEYWSTVITEDGPIVGPLVTNGTVARQRRFGGPSDKPGSGPVTSTVAAGIVHNASRKGVLAPTPDPECPPKADAGTAKSTETADASKEKAADTAEPAAVEPYAAFQSALGAIDALSPETAQEASDAVANGAERPFWAFAAANDKGKLVLEEINVSLLLRKLGTALPAATVSKLGFTDTAFQLLYRRSGNLQLPASYLWLGAKCLIEGTPRARIDLTRALLKASRSMDLVSLGFRFSDLCLVYDWLDKKPKPEEIERSIRIEPIPDYCRAIRREGEIAYLDTRPLLVVEFPRQHVMEEALFRQELPPLPIRQVKDPQDTFAYPPEQSPATWFRDPQKLVDQIAGLTRTERAAVRRRWVEATTPENAADDKDFLDFKMKFEADAVAKPKDEYADQHTKALPEDQQVYIGPFGLDADAMAIGRRILEHTGSEYAGRLVDNVFREVSDQGRRLIEKGNKPGDKLEAALAFEHLLETSVPAYQLFRDYYRERMIDAVVGDATPNFPKPTDLGAAQIEYFAIEDVPAPGSTIPPWSNRTSLPGSEQSLVQQRRDAVLVDYTKALTPSSDQVPEVLRGRLAEPSRLAFRVNCGPASGTMGRLPDAKGREFIAFSLDGLTDWSRHELAVVRRAERLIDPGRDGLLPTRDRRHENIDDGDILAFQGLRSGRFVTAQQRMGEIVASMQTAPSLWETSIELPARLILSTAQDAAWRTPKYFGPDVFWRKYGDQASKAPPATEDASNRLAGGMPPERRAATLWAASIDPDADDPGLRVVHSPDFRPEFFWSRSQRLESQKFFSDSNIRLPGNGAPPRGPLAPWLIGREELDTPAPAVEDIEGKYKPGPDEKKTFKEACAPEDADPGFWLSLSKYLTDRKAVIKRQKRARQFRTSLDAYDRHELVILSSAYGLPVLGRRAEDGKLLEKSSQFEPPQGYALEGLATGSAIYQPRTLNLRELTLTAIGGTLRHDTSFLPPASAQTMGNDNLFDALSIERWQHWAVLGRDVFTEVVYKGFLFPLGHRASLVKLTERIFARASGTDSKGVPNGAVKAYLRQRMYIRVGRPEKDYPAVGQPNGGRQFPVGELRILTAKTPDIVDPMSMPATQTGDIKVALPTGRLPLSGAPGLAFWPRTAMSPDADVVFDVTLDGRLTRLPLIFIDNTAAHDRDSLAAIAKYYNEEIASPDNNAALKDDQLQNGTMPELDPISRLTHKRTLELSGQAVRYCDERKEGDSSHETLAWTLKAQGRRSVPNAKNEGENKTYTFDPVMEGAEQPPFYPALETARILLRQTERFTGRPATASVAQFDGHYVGTGFKMGETPDGPVAEGNATEIYLTLIRPVSMAVGNNGDRTGGMFRPESDFIAISRLKGPIGGSPKPRTEKEGELKDNKVEQSGTLISHVDNYQRFDISGGKDKLVAAYKRYFALDTKLLGLIRLNKLLEYMGLPTPEQGLPLLKEAVDYGIAQAGSAAQMLDQQATAGRTVVQDEVIAPLLKVVEQIEKDWEEAQQQIAAAQPASFGKAVTLATLFPEIGDGLAALRRALSVSMGTTALVPFFESLADIHEAGRQLIAGLKRAGSNASARVDAAIRDKIGELTTMIATRVAEAQELLRQAAEELRTQAIALVIDGLVPEGNDNDHVVSLATFFPSKPTLSGDMKDIVDTAWNELFITRKEARDFLGAVLSENTAKTTDLLKVWKQRLEDAKGTLPAPLLIDLFGRNEKVDAIKEKLDKGIAVLTALLADPLNSALMPAAVRQDIEFIVGIAELVKDLQQALRDKDLGRAAKTVAGIIRDLAGPLGFSERLGEIKTAVNNTLGPIVMVAADAIDKSTFCPVGSTDTSDDLCGRLLQAAKLLDDTSKDLAARVASGFPSSPELGPLKTKLLQISTDLSGASVSVRAMAGQLTVESAAAREIAQNLKPKNNEPFDFFATGEVSELLDNFRSLAVSKASLGEELGSGLEDLQGKAVTIGRHVQDAIAIIAALKQLAEADPQPNPLEMLTAAVGSLFASPAQAALSPSDKDFVEKLEARLKEIEKQSAQATAKVIDNGLSSLNELSTAARKTVGETESAIQAGLRELDQILTQVANGLPVQKTVGEMRTTLGELAKDLDVALDVVGPPNGQLDVNITTFRQLFDQVDWSADKNKTLGELLNRLPAIRANAGKLEAQVAQLAEQSGRSLVGLGKAFIEARLPPVIDLLLNPHKIGMVQFMGIAAIYEELVEGRTTALGEIEKAGLPDIIKDSIKEAMTAPPVEGTTDRLTADRDMLKVLATAAGAKPSTILSDPANRKLLFDFISDWQNGNASPLIIGKNIDAVVQDLLRGEWFKLIDVSAIRNEVERYIKNLIPVRARLAYTFGAPMTANAKDATAGIFMPEEGSRLDITVAASVEFNNPQNVKFEAKGVLGRFAIKLVGDLLDAVTINFHGADFTLSGGGGPQLNVMYDDFVIGPALEYVQKLQAMLGPKDGSGFYLIARLNPLGIEAGYGLGLPIITLGNVSFSNISLNAAVVIPFDGSDARFRASLSRRDAPFTIAVAPYGGSGFFAIEANAEGIVGFEASFEFGGAAAFQFGPLTGIGRLMLGVYIKQMMVEIPAQGSTPKSKRRSTEISATFYVGGAASIWIFTFGASLYVRLGMRDGNMTGIAIFTFSFSMGIVDYDYSVSVERTEKKMGTGQQASIPGQTRVAALGDETFMALLTGPNEFGSWINNSTKCQGVDWTTYRSYFDDTIAPPSDDLFESVAS